MMKVLRSVCQMCGTYYAGCGIDVHVSDSRITKIEGTKGHLVNDGRLCAKGLAALQWEYDRNRLQYPMKRAGERGSGKWQRISWDEALDTIAKKLREIIGYHGPQAIAWLKGQGGGWEENFEWCQRFMNALGSPNIGSTGHNCDIPRRIAHVFTYGAMPDPDYENTKCMLLWGYNPVSTSMSHAAARILRAKQRGAKLIVIDPAFSKTAAKADLYVRIKPCTDGALALAMLNVIIEENLYDKKFVDKWTYGFPELCKWIKQYSPEWAQEITWAPASMIRLVARTYSNLRPAVLHEGNGIDQQPNAVQASRALAILGTITGNLDISGGNVISPEAPPFKRTRDITLRKLTEGDLQKAYDRSVSKNPLFFRLFYCTLIEVINAILTEKPYPIKAAIVQGMNPAITGPNQSRIKEALQKVGFLVVFDVFMTTTAELADIVLPAATFLERTILLPARQKPTVDAIYYQVAPKVVEPMGECKSDYDFIAKLAARMGYKQAFPWKDVKETIDYRLEPVGLSCDDLLRSADIPVTIKYPAHLLYQKYEKFFSNSVLPKKKAELFSTVFERYGYDPLPAYKEPGESPMSRPDLAGEYPLICMASMKPGLYTHSQFRSIPWLNEIMPDPWIEIHAEQAEKLGIKDGDTVIVTSPRGGIEIKCIIRNTMDPRMVAITHGWGDSDTGTYPVTNTLTSDDILCPISDSTTNRCFLVKITRK